MDRRIKDALKIIDKNYCRPLSLLQIAEKVHLSASRFEHLFKSDMSQSYKSYTQHLRMVKAKGLLNRNQSSVKQIAYELGFSYSNNFTRAFKIRFGKPPSECRPPRPLLSRKE